MYDSDEDDNNSPYILSVGSDSEDKLDDEEEEYVVKCNNWNDDAYENFDCA